MTGEGHIFFTNDDIYRELKAEHEREKARGRGAVRTDPKFVVLDRVVQELAIGRIFWAAWNGLKTEAEKHALITRLENVEDYLRSIKKDVVVVDKWHEQMVVTFSKRVYGFDEQGIINTRRRGELEEALFSKRENHGASHG